MTFKIFLINSLILFSGQIIFSQKSHILLVGTNGQFTFSPKNLTITSSVTVIWKWQSCNHSTTSDETTGLEVWG